MSHKNQSPIEANGTHEKVKLNICSILESPLHCWPLTLFYSDNKEITETNGKGKEKMENKLMKISILLVLMGLVILIHVETFGQTSVPGSPGWGQVPGPANVPGSPLWGQVGGYSQPQIHIHQHRSERYAPRDHPGNPWVKRPGLRPEQIERLERYEEMRKERAKRMKKYQRILDEWEYKKR